MSALNILAKFFGKKEHFYTIYIGLDDKDEHRQMYDTSVYIGDLSSVLRQHKIAFTLSKVLGGYYHDDGTFVRENTLKVLLRTNKKELKEIIKTIAKHFNQEAIFCIKHTYETHFFKV